MQRLGPANIAARPLLPVTALVLTVLVFVVDTVTPLEIAVAVFYIVVVFLSVSFCQKRGVVLVSLCCVVLTVVSYFLSVKGTMQSGLINMAISILAIAITCYLALKIDSAKVAIHETREQIAHIGRVTALGELTASIAHEVNQPLAAVVTSGNACQRWLDGETPNIEKARQAVDRMVKDAQRASDIIVHVRNLAKKKPAPREWVDISRLVVETLALTQNEIDKNNIALVTELSMSQPHVFGDRVQLQQTILNLLMNAIEAMSGNASVRGELSIETATNYDEEAIVRVGDTGVGLQADAAARIFEAFYTTKSDGMGIGLAIADSIVKAHGGRITASARQGGGTMFTLQIPKKSDLVS